MFRPCRLVLNTLLVWALAGLALPGPADARRVPSGRAGSCDGVLDYSAELVPSGYQVVSQTDLGDGFVRLEIAVDLAETAGIQIAAASLFPDREWPSKSVFAIKDSPKPPPQRVTLGVKTLQACTRMLIMVTGDNKVEAIARWLGGAQLPIARVADVDHALVLVERVCMPDNNTPQAP